METHSYAVARAGVMRSLLLSREDYAKMKRMGLHEMIRSLETGQYGAEIASLGALYKGSELINMALNASIAGAVNKLIRIANKKSARNVISLYADKWVYANLKLVARKVVNGLSDEDMKYGIVPVTPTTLAFCTRSAKSAESACSAIARITGIKAEVISRHIREKDTASLENEIDRHYYARLARLAGASKDVKKFFSLMSELINVRNIMRMKHHGMPAEAISKFIIGAPSALASKLLQHDYNAALALLEKSNKELAQGVRAKRTQLENNAERMLLRSAAAMMRRQPLSVSPVFGYMIRKEAEVRNIRLLVNAKMTGLSESFVEETLVE